MKFALLLYGDESVWADMSPEELQQSVEVWNAFGQQLIDAGALVTGEALAPTSEATTVRLTEGELVRTDGPFAETREQLGGYYRLDCKDLDEAIGWAARIPDAATGCVEVRPVMNYEALGAEHPDQTREASER